MKRRFSYADEEQYYQDPIIRERPYQHLERYLACLTRPVRFFGGKRVLDIGAGECLYTQLLAKHLGVKRAIALELFPHRMQVAARPNKANPALSFVAGDCYGLPFSDGSFDIVLGVGVLHHLPEVEKAVQEIRRVLAPGGRYIGYEPNGFNAWVLWSYLFGHRSQNEYVLWPRKLREAFVRTQFDVFTRYFWARFPFLTNRFLTTSVGIIAER